MPEKVVKELFGETTEAHSSDDFIERQAEALKSENYGLDSQVIDVSNDDLLTPLPINTPFDSNEKNSDSSFGNVVTLSKITHKHSAFGASVQELRNKKKQSKRAA